MSAKLKSSSLPVNQPFSRANETTSFAYSVFFGSLRGNWRMRAWFAWAETWPSGTRRATHTAPFRPGPFPIISRIQTSFGSEIEKDSPVAAVAVLGDERRS